MSNRRETQQLSGESQKATNHRQAIINLILRRRKSQAFLLFIKLQ